MWKRSALDRTAPIALRRRLAGSIALGLLLSWSVASAQAPSEAGSGPSEADLAPPEYDSAPSQADSTPPEYDPGADHHFLLPTGRVSPRRTGSAGLAAAALPTAAFGYVAGSPLPRTSLRFSALVGLEDPSAMMPLVSATVQPLSADRVQGSVTVLTSIRTEGADVDLRTLLGSLSFGDDSGRLTVALGSASSWGAGDAWPLFAVGWDYEVDSRHPRVVEVGGRLRTVRTRVKLVGEVWSIVGDVSGSTIGFAGLRMSGEKMYVDLVVPFVAAEGSFAFAPMPLVNLGFTM